MITFWWCFKALKYSSSRLAFFLFSSIIDTNLIATSCSFLSNRQYFSLPLAWIKKENKWTLHQAHRKKLEVLLSIKQNTFLRLRLFYFNNRLFICSHEHNFYNCGYCSTQLITFTLLEEAISLLITQLRKSLLFSSLKCYSRVTKKLV